LIVVALIAVLASSVVLGPGMLRSSRMRSAATLMVSAVRLGLNRSNATGHPVRLTLDLTENRVMLEEAVTGSFARVKGGVAGGAEAESDAEKKAKADAERIVEGPHAPRTQFRPLKELTDPDDPTRARDLGAGVQIASVETEHDEEPVTEGRAYVFFWPGGLTERAAIRLKRSDLSDEGLTVLISALNGRAKIVHGKAEVGPLPEDPEGQGSSDEEAEP
jgi:general secretion pathway protein H